MASEPVLYWIAGAVVISAIALVTNALAALGVYRSVRKVQEDITPLIPQAKAALLQAEETLKTSLIKIEALAEKADVTLSAAAHQIDELGVARADMTERVRVQAERLELVLDDTLSRFQDVVGTVHRGVIRPAREVSGVLAGIRAAVQTFAAGRRPSVDRATHDEEMFI
jgi:hypothetical protein